jgi:hypothetical protein
MREGTIESPDQLKTIEIDNVRPGINLISKQHSQNAQQQQFKSALPVTGGRPRRQPVVRTYKKERDVFASLFNEMSSKLKDFSKKFESGTISTEAPS